jgi:lysophospholipid acyltransferase (LPLAT)-like uncharacterized protein
LIITTLVQNVPCLPPTRTQHIVSIASLAAFIYLCIPVRATHQRIEWQRVGPLQELVGCIVTLWHDVSHKYVGASPIMSCVSQPCACMKSQKTDLSFFSWPISSFGLARSTQGPSLLGSVSASNALKKSISGNGLTRFLPSRLRRLFVILDLIRSVD